MTLPLLLATLAVSGAEPVLRVDGIELTPAAISQRAAALREGKRSFTAEDLVEALVDEAVLAADARRQGLDRDPAVRPLVEQARQAALADAYARSRLATYAFTDAELQDIYHQSTDTVRLEMVSVATEAEARQVRARLEAGGEIALEAARSLDSRSAARKGDTGHLTRVQLAPALAKLAFEAPIGSLIGPVPLTAGFGVARVAERKIADAAGFAARRPALEAFARKQAVTATRTHLTGQLRKQYRASVDEPSIEALGRRTDFTPAELDKAIATVGDDRIPLRVLIPRTQSLGGHLTGPGTRIQFAWTLVDERALARAAREAKFDADPVASIDVAAAEIQALATAMADRIAAKAGAKASPGEREQAVRKRIGALRGELPIRLDRKAALAAAEAQR